MVKEVIRSDGEGEGEGDNDGDIAILMLMRAEQRGERSKKVVAKVKMMVMVI